MIADRRTTANPFDNQDFRSEMSAMFKEELKPIVDKQKEHGETLIEHERIIQRGKGIAWLMGVALALLEAVHWKRG
jgi:hypothetical protein